MILNIILILTILGLAFYSIRQNKLLNIKIKDLNDRISETNSSLDKTKEELKNSIKIGSDTVLESAKKHLDAATLVMSKRIGKARKPKADDSK